MVDYRVDILACQDRVEILSRVAEFGAPYRSQDTFVRVVEGPAVAPPSVLGVTIASSNDLIERRYVVYHNLLEWLEVEREEGLASVNHPGESGIGHAFEVTFFVFETIIAAAADVDM